jgi:flavorubredoxin
MQYVNITDNIYFLSYNDRRIHLFENLWPVPYGISYNSYLIVDEKIVLIDTVEHSFTDEYLDSIEEIIGGRKIDYLVVNHMEPDHSGAIKAVVKKYPGIIITGNKRTFGLIENFYLNHKNIKIIDDGDTLKPGKHLLQFQTIPMVHWPETMVTYEEKNKILFSGDAFGSFGTLDGGVFDDELNLEFREEETMRYFTNIVGKYCPHTQRAIKKLEPFEIKIIAPTHGPVWRNDPGWILKRYNKWSSYELDTGVVIAYGSMYGHTMAMAEVIARRLAVRGIKNIRIYDVSKTHPSYIINDIFKYKGFIVGSAAYNNTLFPSVQNLVSLIEEISPKDHYLGIFGNFSWSGGGVKNLKLFAEKIKWELVYDPVEEKGSLKEDNSKQLIRLADAMADKLQGK